VPGWADSFSPGSCDATASPPPCTRRTRPPTRARREVRSTCTSGRGCGHWKRPGLRRSSVDTSIRRVSTRGCSTGTTPFDMRSRRRRETAGGRRSTVPTYGGCSSRPSIRDGSCGAARSRLSGRSATAGTRWLSPTAARWRPTWSSARTAPGRGSGRCCPTRGPPTSGSPTWSSRSPTLPGATRTRPRSSAPACSSRCPTARRSWGTAAGTPGSPCRCGSARSGSTASTGPTLRRPAPRCWVNWPTGARR
jgi:hypothetical protein